MNSSQRVYGELDRTVFGLGIFQTTTVKYLSTRATSSATSTKSIRDGGRAWLPMAPTASSLLTTWNYWTINPLAVIVHRQGNPFFRVPMLRTSSELRKFRRVHVVDVVLVLLRGGSTLFNRRKEKKGTRKKKRNNLPGTNLLFVLFDGFSHPLLPF